MSGFPDTIRERGVSEMRDITGECRYNGDCDYRIGKEHKANGWVSTDEDYSDFVGPNLIFGAWIDGVWTVDIDPCAINATHWSILQPPVKDK